MKNNKSDKKFLLGLYEWVETFIFALAAVVIIFTFLLKFVMVSGESMLQSFHDGDRLLITATNYTPERGDVVVVDVSHNLEELGYVSNAPYIKRVIATEGQTVDIDSATWTVYVDGEPVDEPYVYHCNNLNMVTTEAVKYPYTVPEGCVFVMGDNRSDSSDSRSMRIGLVDTRRILGKVVVRVTPFSRFGKVN